MKGDRHFVVVQNIPSPYRLHLFSVLARVLGERQVGLHVHFMAHGHDERPDSWRNPAISFPHTYWGDFGFRTHHWNPGLLKHLRSAAPDYLLVGSGWDTFTGVFVSLFARRGLGILWTEGNTKTPGRLGGPLGAFKRFILGRFDFVAVPGEEGRRYVALHQSRTRRPMPRPILLPNLIDESRFRVRDQWPEHVVAETRQRFLGQTADRLALCPARLEPAKGLVDFVRRLAPGVMEGWRLLVVGEGSQKVLLEKVIYDRGLSDRILLLNYVPYDEMPLLYAAADLFVLPSVYDPNPLSVIEAMHSGLPLLLSQQAGNYPEALVEGVTGWGFSPFDEAAVAEAVKRAFSAPADRLRAVGRASKSRAAQVWGSETAIRAFVDAAGILAPGEPAT